VTRFVLDASVALAWVVDRNPDPYAALVQQKVQGGERAVVPVLWQLEITNVLAAVQRRGVLSGGEVEEGLRYFESFLAAQVEIISAFPGMREILRLARELGLTSYDALYVDLARREGLPLATLDRRLRTAATKAGAALLK
jgi:predicted nucleic acid-binding protein